MLKSRMPRGGVAERPAGYTYLGRTEKNMRRSRKMIIAAAAMGAMFLFAGCDAAVSPSDAAGEAQASASAAESVSAAASQDTRTSESAEPSGGQSQEASPEVSGTAPNPADDPAAALPTADQAYATLPVLGTIVDIDREQDIYYVSEEQQGAEGAAAADGAPSDDPATQVGCVEAEDCIIIDSQTGAEVDDDRLQVGDRVLAFVGLAMTRSLPPQAQCYAIVTNLSDNNLGSANYVRALSVDQTDDGLRILNQNADLYITVPPDLQIEVFDENRTASASDIQPGTRMIVWYDAVMKSYPGQTTATRIMLDLDD